MKYITYYIENIEPLKQANTLMQSDNEYTKSYISGSNIRGAFIANYISQKKVKNINEGEHRKKLLQGGIKFLNAYPVNSNKNRSLPFPKCYYAEKDEIKKFSISGNLKLVEFGDKFEEDKDYDKIKIFDFVNWNLEEENFNPIQVEKISNLHISKSQGEDNKIFRYEAINSGQTFKGIIICEDDNYIEECEDILKNGIFYLGGSKGSGYGLCKVSKVQIKDENPEIEELEDILAEDETDELIVVATSDIIYRDEFGVYKAFVDEEYLKNELGVENVVLKESFVETEYFTGFNNKWGYKLPNVLGIKAGSVFVYKIEGNLDEDKIESFINKGVGERKAEGFGRVALLSDLPFESINKESKAKEKFKKVVLNKEEEQQMTLIVNRIYREKLNNKLPEHALRLNEQLNSNINIKSNQWGKLYNMMFLLEGLTPEEGIDKIKNYFNNINNKKLNTELKHSFKRIKIKDIELQDYIISELSNLEEKSFSTKYLENFKIDKIKSNISKKEIYEYKVKLLKEFFRLQLRESNRKEEI